MQVTGEKIVRENVRIEVNPFEMWCRLRHLILAKNGLSGVEYLRGDGTPGNPWVMKQDDPHHRHGSISEEVVIANPTEREVKLWQALDTVTRMVNFNELEK
jgi:hypothetical protein